MSHEIKFEIQLDENKIPEKIQWTATGSSSDQPKDAKALLISLWDLKENVTLAIDLWTKEMLVSDMGLLYYQTLIHLAESYERATFDKTAGDKIREAAEKFADHLQLSSGKTPPPQDDEK